MADFGTKTGTGGTPIANTYDATPALTDRVPITGGRETAVQDILDTFYTGLDTATALTTVVGGTAGNAAAGRTLADLTDDMLATAGVPAAIGAGATVLQAGSGAVAITIQNKLRESVSVKDFGAIGDGNIANANADTAAFQAALATGKSVFVPFGVYMINATLVVATGGQTIYGVGHTGSIIRKCTDDAYNLINVTASWGSGLFNIKLEEASVSYTNTDNLLVLAVNGGTDVILLNTWFLYGHTQLRMEQGTSNITMLGCVFETARKRSIYSKSSLRNKLIGCTFWKNTADISNPADRGYAVHLDKDALYDFGSDNWTITGNYFAENVYGPFLRLENVKHIMLGGNFFEIASQVDNGVKSDIEIEGCDGVVIVGNTSNVVNNSYSAGQRGSKYVVELIGSSNSNIKIELNDFTPGVTGTILDTQGIVQGAGGGLVATALPVLINGSSTGITHAAQTGKHLRNGRSVTFSATTTLSSKGASSGVVTLGPLPYAPAETSFCSGFVTNTSGISTGIFYQLNTNGYAYPSHAVNSNILDTNIADDSTFYLSGSYVI